MKHLCTIILAAILCATATAQTVRTLAYNISNNTVIGATNTNTLTWSNSFAWSTNTLAGATRTNLALGWSGLTNTNASSFRSALQLSASWLTNTNVTNFRTAVELGEFNIVQFEGVVANAIYGGTNTTNDIVLDTQNFAIYGGTVQVFNWDTNFVNFNVPVQFNNTTNAATTRINFGFSTNLNTLWTATNTTNARTGLGFSTNLNSLWSSTNSAAAREAIGLTLGANYLYVDNIVLAGTNGLAFDEPDAAGATRTNLSIPLAALTNTSNVTMMRALAGSTNTNHPYSGSISVTGTNNTNTLVFSNGILQSVQ